MSSTQRRSWNVSPSFLMQVVGRRSQSTTGDGTGTTELEAGALVSLSWWDCVCKDHMSLLCPGPALWYASLAIKWSELLHGDVLKQGLIMSGLFPQDGIPRLQLSVTTQASGVKVPWVTLDITACCQLRKVVFCLSPAFGAPWSQLRGWRSWWWIRHF